VGPQCFPKAGTDTSNSRGEFTPYLTPTHTCASGAPSTACRFGVDLVLMLRIVGPGNEGARNRRDVIEAGAIKIEEVCSDGPSPISPIRQSRQRLRVRVVCAKCSNMVLSLHAKRQLERLAACYGVTRESS
jgi:hypothetical protein